MRLIQLTYANNCSKGKPQNRAWEVILMEFQSILMDWWNCLRLECLKVKYKSCRSSQWDKVRVHQDWDKYVGELFPFQGCWWRWAWGQYRRSPCTSGSWLERAGKMQSEEASIYFTASIWMVCTQEGASGLQETMNHWPGICIVGQIWRQVEKGTQSRKQTLLGQLCIPSRAVQPNSTL